MILAKIRFLRCGHTAIGRDKHRCCKKCGKDLSPHLGIRKRQAIDHIRTCSAVPAQVAPAAAADRRAPDDTGFDAAPDRYMASGREAIDVIRDELGDAGCRAFCVGNARKYELRAGHKAGSSEDNDREKARWYRMFAAFIDGLGPDPRSYRSTT